MNVPPGTDSKFNHCLLKIKPNRSTNFSNLFLNETIHVSDSSSVHHQEFSTVHTTMVYVMKVCWQLAKRIRMFHPDPAPPPDDGQRNCPKHVEFHSKNNFEKLVQLVGFILRNLSRCTVTWTSKLITVIGKVHNYSICQDESWLVFR